MDEPYYLSPSQIHSAGPTASTLVGYAGQVYSSAPQHEITYPHWPVPGHDALGMGVAFTVTSVVVVRATQSLLDDWFNRGES